MRHTSGIWQPIQQKTFPMSLVTTISNMTQITTLSLFCKAMSETSGTTRFFLIRYYRSTQKAISSGAGTLTITYPLSEASTFNETTAINGQTVEDFSHSNSLD